MDSAVPEPFGADPFTSHKPNGSGPAPLWIDDDAWTEGDLPQRPWVAQGYALRGAVTIVTGPPSAMKSSLMLAWACATALGQPHGNFRPTEAGDVIVYNVEDNQIEQRRRLSAVLRQFDAIPGDIRGKIIRAGPGGIGTLFSWNVEMGVVLNTAALDTLRALIEERRPAILIADPLSELHSADENDNTALRAVVAEFRALAICYNVAIILVHHTRKGAVTPGDPDTARGASAIIGAGRVVLTLVTMSEEDAVALGLAKDRKTRSTYVRLDDAKQNYAAIGEANWYEKTVYALDNGEWVPAAVPWTAPDMWESIPTVTANEILDTINAGIDGGKRRYSDGGNAGDRAAWPVVAKHIPSLNEKQARKAITTWVDNGTLISRQYTDETDRKKRKGLYLSDDPKKRPGNAQ